MTKGMYVFILISVFCFGLPICFCLSNCYNPYEPKVLVKSQSYQPCYIRLDEEQFEKLIDALKKDEK